MDSTEDVLARLKQHFVSPAAIDSPVTDYSGVAQKVEAETGGLSSAQMKRIFEKSKSLPDGASILLIGCDGGRASLTLAAACAGSGKRLYVMDAWMAKPGAIQDPGSSLDAWRGMLSRHGLDGVAIPVQGNAAEALSAGKGPSEIDFAILGAAGEYVEHVKILQLVFSRVRQGGWLAFRDAAPECPGAWRTWLSFGTPLLSESESEGGLSIGRKSSQSGFDFLGRPHTDFSYAQAWRRRLIEAVGGSADGLARAMAISLEGRYGSERERDALHAAEIEIGGMPEGSPYRASLRRMLSLDAKVDGHLMLWNALTLMSEGHWEDAYRGLLASTRVSRPIPVERIREYCVVLLENLGPAGKSLPEPGAADFGSVSADSIGGSAGHYGQDYFNWQKRIGAFGGVANLFKFKDHIKPADTVVDLGSGGGFLLTNVVCARKMGVEINPTARREAALYAGIDSVERPEDLPDDFADVIISNHALEHMHSPLQVLRTLLPKLKPGGQLVIVVPNDPPQDKWDANDINKHLFTWNPMTLGNLVALAGYSVRLVEAIQHQWPPNFTEVYRQLGEDGFHAACREQAKRTGNHQIRLVASR